MLSSAVPLRADVEERLLLRFARNRPVRLLRHFALLTTFVVTSAVAQTPEYPTELSKWLAYDPPGVSDERWFAANNDTKHEWVVFLNGVRPSVRLRAVKQEKGTHPLSWQESYPRMPFQVPHASAQDGLSGEWFSIKVSDGWIIGYNAGEWGGALWWFSPDGKKRERISRDQVIGFFETKAGLLALEGLAHGFMSVGQIVRLAKGSDGRWRTERFVDLKAAPAAAVLGGDATLIVATTDRLLRVDLPSRKVDVLVDHGFWGGLYPKSMMIAPSGEIYLGMRHGVAKFTKVDGVYRTRWLVPDSSFDRLPPGGPRVNLHILVNGKRRLAAMREAAMRKRWVIAVFVGTPLVMLTIVAAHISAEVWRFCHRPAAILYQRSERVTPGMRLEAASAALGRAGRKVQEWELPETVDDSRPMGFPGRLRPVVSGDEFYRWETDDGAYLVVSLKNGVVREKYFYEPSL